MFESGILGVIISLVFVYTIVSLIGAGVTEFIADKFLSLRAENLRQALEHLLRDDPVPEGAGTPPSTAARFLGNALYQGLGKPSLQAPGTDAAKSEATLPDKRHLPSYLPQRRFAMVIMDMLIPGDAAAAEKGYGEHSVSDFAAAAKRLPKGPARDAILAHIAQAEGDLNALRGGLESWFNETMDRASGWYKRKTRSIVFAASLAVAVVLNADTFMIVERLSTDRTLLAKTVESALLHAEHPHPNAGKEPGLEALVKEAKQGALFGWTSERNDPRAFPWRQDNRVSAFFTKLSGLLVTALAAMLGAPLWFDILNKLVNLRGTGRAEQTRRQKPEGEKS